MENSSFKSPLLRKKHRDFRGFFFISPWLIGFLTFQLFPFVSSFVYSFTNYNIVKKPIFNGVDNYIRLFTIDPDFVNSFIVTFKYAFMAVPLKLAFALFIALLLNTKIRGVNFLRTVYYMPSILGGSVAISALWKLMFLKDGIINNIIGKIGIPAIDWLGSTKVALFTISLLTVWQFGSSMVLFLAALKQVPQDMYEAASIDGASWWTRFRRITVPMITPIIFFNLVMQTINALQNFTAPFVITRGGPLKSTYLIGLKLYVEGFGNFKMGYASAISWVLFFIILCFTLLTFKSSSAWVYYGDGENFS
jgi:oligogalacturonide transport system permease protein